MSEVETEVHLVDGTVVMVVSYAGDLEDAIEAASLAMNRDVNQLVRKIEWDFGPEDFS